MSPEDCYPLINSNKNYWAKRQSFSTIYLVRHGQTIGNASRVFLDASKEVLSSKGRAQAKAAGEHLSHVKFDRAFSSNLIRAKKTAKLILEHSQYPPNCISFDERIKEVDYGIFKGQSYDEPPKLRGKNVSDSYPYKEFFVEGTEDIEFVLLRLDSFWNELFETLDKAPTSENVLVVSHGMLIRILMKYLALSPEKFQLENFSSSLYLTYLKNAAYHKFQIERKPMNTKCSAPRIIRIWESHNGSHLKTLKTLKTGFFKSQKL